MAEMPQLTLTYTDCRHECTELKIANGMLRDQLRLANMTANHLLEMQREQIAGSISRNHYMARVIDKRIARQQEMIIALVACLRRCHDAPGKDMASMMCTDIHATIHVLGLDAEFDRDCG